MPFDKGNQAAKGRRNPTPKTIWLLESLQKHGFNYEVKLAALMERALKGDRHALDMLHLLVKMVPYIANAPKSEHAAVQIDKLVINRIAAPPSQEEGHPPLIVDTTAVNIPSQSEEK